MASPQGNTEVFRTKIGAFYAVSAMLVLMVNVGVLLDNWGHGTTGESVLMLLASGSVVVIIVWCTFTKYVIEARTFFVRCGPFRWRIPLASIVSLEPNYEFNSAPALAMDRLEVAHTKGRVIISPHRKMAFAEALKRAVASAGGPELDISKVDERRI